MRVTAKGEYATQAVLYLALQYPGVLTIHEIAQRHHIPLKYLEQVLLELKRGGILESRRPHRDSRHPPVARQLEPLPRRRGSRQAMFPLVERREDWTAHSNICSWK